MTIITSPPAPDKTHHAAGIVCGELRLEILLFRIFQADYLVLGKVGGRPIQNRLKGIKDLPATSKESDALSKDLKQRGFKFVGSTIMYAHMQAVGMVNDHLVTCFRHKAVARMK